MNQRRRSRLREALTLLNSASNIVSIVYDTETDALSNIPENLENSELYAGIEAASDCLSDAVSSIDEAIASLEEAIA